MPDRIIELQAQVAALHFAVSQLWVKEFERYQDPLAAAEEYAAKLNAVLQAGDQVDLLPLEESQLDEIKVALLGLFEQIASELRSKKGVGLDS